MFRSKTKKDGGRKRREVELKSDSIEATVSKDVHATSSAEIPVSNASETTENDLYVLDQLRRRRSRAVKGAMTFNSKRRSIRSSQNGAITTGLQMEETGLLLSFDDNEKKTKKRRIRPNIVASNAVKVDVELESNGRYSVEMLAALRSEQSVLLSSNNEVIQVEKGEDEDVKKMVVEEEEEEEEEFITLDMEEKMKRGRRTTNRVNFGVQLECLGISKKVEVIEEIISDGGDEEEEQNRRWEEELMRRGGHRVQQPTETNGRLARDGLPTYPTRKKVTCVSLGNVLGKLEKSVELTSLEDQLALRELARLEAETALMETALKQQQEELLTSSEEFEFFQEVEDFVKGLSFCLRAKVRVIIAMEEKIVDERARRVKDKQQEEQHGIAQKVQYYLSSGKLQQADIVGLNQLNLHSSGDDTDVSSVHDSDTSRMQKYQSHFTESYVADPHHTEEDLFADAINEINSLERVYGRFQEWKAKFPQVYRDVYCELAQEKLLAPYVQAEMLHWDPLAVADEQIQLGKSWSLDDFAWFRILHQHLAELGDGSRKGENVDGPILYHIRDVLLGKVRTAISSYFDPYSSLQTRSLSLVLEEISRHGYCAQVEAAVQILVSIALDAFSSEAKRAVLVAIDQHAVASGEDVNLFARYLLERFNTLQDNLLTLFVALPKGTIAASGFRCLLQVLYHLLGYVRQCQETHKTQLVKTATQIVRQLSGSSYLLQLLSEPSQERDLMHILELFKPFLQTTTQ
ncbi:hypothetical protein DD238_007717 [Peronospora effusa]|uniref:GCF C-terminal domain-containing protein n=1 Tax=Peronospora effusa TaxID=542832 RepID=A0A3M6V787_9STRA|nr:hypothetical protein DD238_007717 [Peronospora effusa]